MISNTYENMAEELEESDTMILSMYPSFKDHSAP